MDAQVKCFMSLIFFNLCATCQVVNQNTQRYAGRSGLQLPLPKLYSSYSFLVNREVKVLKTNSSQGVVHRPEPSCSINHIIPFLHFGGKTPAVGENYITKYGYSSNILIKETSHRHKVKSGQFSSLESFSLFVKSILNFLPLSTLPFSSSLSPFSLSNTLLLEPY